MATLETAYELSGLADYLLASPALVPVEGWPYDAMFESPDRRTVATRRRPKRILGSAPKRTTACRRTELGTAEVPYSLLSTRGAAPSSRQLGDLVGDGRGKQHGIRRTRQLRQRRSAEAATDRRVTPRSWIWVRLVPASWTRGRQSAKRTQTGQEHGRIRGRPFNGARECQPRESSKHRPRGHARPRTLTSSSSSHTGTKFGGRQRVRLSLRRRRRSGNRDSRGWLDEKAYRRLAISTDTKLGRHRAAVDAASSRHGQRPDVSAAIALLEQLQRLGVGMAGRLRSCRPNVHTSGAWPALPDWAHDRGRRGPGSGVRARSRNWPRAWLPSRPTRAAPTLPDKGGADFCDDDKGAARLSRTTRRRPTSGTALVRDSGGRNGARAARSRLRLRGSPLVERAVGQTAYARASRSGRARCSSGGWHRLWMAAVRARCRTRDSSHRRPLDCRELPARR